MNIRGLQELLNPEQFLAVTTIDGPLLIIAGAGSGKTRVITYRIANMLDKGIPQREILALTFTNKAAREMETRIKEISGKPLQSLSLSTFHAFGSTLLRNEIQHLGFRNNFSIYDGDDTKQLIRECFRECKINPEGIDIEAVAQTFSRVKTGQLFYSDLEPYAGVYEEYERTKKIYNSVDFDDLLTLPVELFKIMPNIHEKYHKRYRYILIDEFQDTSLIQYNFLKLLSYGPDSPPDSINICAVGDDDQSIYSWRGANYQNIVNFEKDFKGVKEIKLERNYRSTTTILDAANGVISNNSARKEKKLIASGNSSGKSILFFTPENENEEAEFIAERIHGLRLSDKLRYDDFGVLVRTNSLTTAIEDAFLSANIPYHVSGGKSIFERQETKDILAYLRVIGNTDDDVNLMRIINVPRRGIGKSTISKISETAGKKNTSLWNALTEMRYVQNALFEMKDKEEIDEFMSLIENERETIFKKSAGTLSKKVRELVDKIDYWSYLITEYKQNDSIARFKFMNIERVIQSIETWENNPDNFEPGLYQYLNRISLMTRGDSDDDESGKVNLMTIHKSKGLEFPVVFIAGAEDEIIPNKKTLEEDDDAYTNGGIEEERRLFYVAITRAKNKLFITSSRNRKRGKSSTPSMPSPFIDEIPKSLIEFYTESAEEEISIDDFFAMTKSKLASKKT